MNLPGNTVIDLLAVLPDGQLVHEMYKFHILKKNFRIGFGQNYKYQGIDTSYR